MKHRLRMVCVLFVSLVAAALACSHGNAFAEELTIDVVAPSEATFNRKTSFDYAIVGGSGDYITVTAAWFIEGNDFYDIGTVLTSGATGTVSVTPCLTEEMRGAESYRLWLNLSVTDSEGATATKERSVEISESEYEALSLSVWFDREEADAGEEVTMSYRITGGQTPYTRRMVSALFFDEVESWRYNAFYDGMIAEIPSEGSFTFTPETGDLFQCSMEIADADGNTVYADTAQIGIIGGKKITNAFEPELSFENGAELYLNRPVKVLYDLGDHASNYDSLKLRLSVYKSDDTYSAVSDTVTLKPDDKSGELSMLLNVSTGEAMEMADCPLTARIELLASDAYGRSRYYFVEKEIADRISAGFIPGTNEGEEFRVDVTLADDTGIAGEPLYFEYAVSGGSGNYAQIYYDILDQLDTYCGSFPLYDASGRTCVTLRRDGLYRLYFRATDTDGRVCSAESDVFYVNGVGVSLSTSQSHVTAGDTVAVAYELSGGTAPYYLEWEWQYRAKDSYETISKKSFGLSEGTGELTYVVPNEAEEVFLVVSVTDANHAEGFAEISFSADEREGVFISYDRTMVESGQLLTARYEVVNSDGNCELLDAWWEMEESSIRNVRVDRVSLTGDGLSGEARLTAPLYGDRITFCVRFRDSNGEEREARGKTVINRAASIAREPLTIQVIQKSDEIRLDEPAEFEYGISGWTGEYASANVNSFIYLYPVDGMGDVYSGASDAVALDAREAWGTFALTPAIYDDVSWLPCDCYDLYMFLTVNVADAYGRDQIVQYEFPVAGRFYPKAVIPGEGAGEALSVSVTAEQTECELGEPMRFEYEVRGGSGEYSEIMFELIGDNDSRGGRLYNSKGSVSLENFFDGNHYLRITAVDANTGETAAGASPVVCQHGVSVRLAFDKPVYADGETIKAGYTVKGAPGDTTVSASWYGWKNGEYFSNEKPADFPTGTTEFTIDGEENVGLFICVLGRHVNVSSDRMFSIYRPDGGGERFAFEFDTDKAKAGETLTANYRFIDAHDGLRVENAYWYVKDQIGTGYWVHFEDQQTIDETGSFTFVPETGDSIELYVCVSDGERNYTCARTIPVEGGVKVTKPLSADIAQEGEAAQIGKPFTVDYELSGLAEAYSSIRAEWAYSFQSDEEGSIPVLIVFDEAELGQKQGTMTICPTDVPSGGRSQLVLTFYALDVYGRSDSVSKAFALGGVSLDRAEVSVGETVSVSYYLNDCAENSFVKRAGWIVTDTNGEEFALENDSQTPTLPSGTLSFVPRFGERLSFEICVVDEYGVERTYGSESIEIKNAPSAEEPLSVRLSARGTPEFFKDFTVDYAISGWTGEYAELRAQWLLGYRNEAGEIVETEAVGGNSAYSFDAAGSVTGEIIPGEIVTKENSGDMFVMLNLTVSDVYGRQRTVSGMYDIENKYAYPIPGSGAGEPLTVTLTPDRPQIIAGETVRFTYSVTGGTGEYTNLFIFTAIGDVYRLWFADGFVDIRSFGGYCACTLYATDTDGTTAETEASVQTILLDATVTPSDEPLYPGQEVTFRFDAYSNKSVESVLIRCWEKDGEQIYEDTMTGAEGSATIRIPMTEALAFTMDVTLDGGFTGQCQAEIPVDLDGGIFLRPEQYDEAKAGEALTVYYDLRMAGPFNFVGSEWIFSDGVDVGSQFTVAPVIENVNTAHGSVSVVPESGDSVMLHLAVTDAVGRHFDEYCGPIPISGGRKCETPIRVTLTPGSDAEYEKLFALDYEISGGVGEYSRMELDYAIACDEAGYTNIGRKTVVNPAPTGRVSYPLYVGNALMNELKGKYAQLEVYVFIYDAYGRSTSAIYYYDLSGEPGQSAVIQGEGAGTPLSVEIVPDKTEFQPGELVSAAYRVSGGTAQYASIRAELIGSAGESAEEMLTETEGRVSFADMHAGEYIFVVTATDTNGSVCRACSEVVTLNGLRVSLRADATDVKPGDLLTVYYEITGGSGFYSMKANCDTDIGSEYLGTRYASSGAFQFTVPDCQYGCVSCCATDMNGSGMWKTIDFNIRSDEPYAVFDFDRDEAVRGEPIRATYRILNVAEEDELCVNWLGWTAWNLDGSSAVVTPPFDSAAREGSFVYTPLDNGTLRFEMDAEIQGEYYHFSSRDVTVMGGEPVQPIRISVAFANPVADFYAPIECAYDVSGWNGVYDALRMNQRFCWYDEYGCECSICFDSAELDPHAPSGTVVVTPVLVQGLLTEGSGRNVWLECDLEVEGIGGKRCSASAMCPIASPVPEDDFVIPGSRAGEPLSVTVVPDARESTTYLGMSAAYEVWGGTAEYTGIECAWAKAYYEDQVIASEPLYRASGAVRADYDEEGLYVCIVTVRDTEGRQARAVSQPIALTKTLNLNAPFDWDTLYAIGDPIRQTYAVTGGSGAYTVSAELMCFSESAYDYETIETRELRTPLGEFEFMPEKAGSYRLTLRAFDEESGMEGQFENYFSVEEGMVLNFTADKREDVPAGEPVTVRYRMSGGSGEYEIVSCEWEIIDDNSPKAQVVTRVPVDAASLPLPEGEVVFTPTMGERNRLRMTVKDCQTEEIKKRDHLITVVGAEGTPSVTVTSDGGRLEFGVPMEFTYQISGGSGSFTDFTACLHTLEWENDTVWYVLDVPLTLTGREGVFSLTPELTEALVGCYSCDSGCQLTCELSFTDAESGLRLYGSTNDLLWLASGAPHVVFAGDAESLQPASAGADGHIGSLVCSLCGTTLAEDVVISRDRVMSLPSGLTRIEDEAFRNLSMRQVTVPDGVASIGSAAFADCGDLVLAVLPNGIQSIAADAFSGCEKLIVMCGESNKKVIEWAIQNGTPICLR